MKNTQSRRWLGLLLGLIFVGTMALPLSAQTEARAEGDLIGFEAIVELLQKVAAFQYAEKGIVAEVIGSFMNELISFLDEQNILSEVLDLSEAKFGVELEAFQQGLITAATFREMVAELTRELLARAEEGGVGAHVRKDIGAWLISPLCL